MLVTAKRPVAVAWCQALALPRHVGDTAQLIDAHDLVVERQLKLSRRIQAKNLLTPPRPVKAASCSLGARWLIIDSASLASNSWLLSHNHRRKGPCPASWLPRCVDNAGSLRRACKDGRSLQSRLHCLPRQPQRCLPPSNSRRKANQGSARPLMHAVGFCFALLVGEILLLFAVVTQRVAVLERWSREVQQCLGLDFKGAAIVLLMRCCLFVVRPETMAIKRVASQRTGTSHAEMRERMGLTPRRGCP